MTRIHPVFDGHNDLLLRLFSQPAQREAIWFGDDARGHLDLPRMEAGRFAGGLFAIYIPSAKAAGIDYDRLMDHPPYAVDLPPAIDATAAQPVALAMAGHFQWMERAASGRFRICRSARDIRAAMDAGSVAGVLHMEGAEAIGPDLDALHVFHALGLRSLGPVWSRPNIFGHGVPFRFPADPDTGPGLTDAGKALVAACGKLRILVDLSHLNAAGVEDVAACSDLPLVATHSNAHALCASSRNLTDRQLAMIAERDGLVGLNFATVFLRPDGRRSPDIGWDTVLRQLDYLIGKLGETRVGLGSDFDGATVPECLRDVAGLPALQEAMRKHGYGESLIAAICHGNWLHLLERVWGE
jgi:membrane dipeptidase